MEKIFSFKSKEMDFSHSVWISFIFHVLIIILVIVLYHLASSPGREISFYDTKAFAKALEEVRQEIFPHKPITVKNKIEALSKEEVLKKLKEIRVPNFKLNEKQKVEFYKKMIKFYMSLEDKEKIDQNPDISRKKVFDLFKDADRIQLDSGGKIYESKIYSGDKKEILFIPQRKMINIRSMRIFEDVEKKQTKIRGGKVEVKTGEGVKYIPGPYYFRESPYEEIMAHGARFFFISRGFPELGATPFLKDTDIKKDTHAFLKTVSSDFQVVYLYDHSDTQSQTLSESWKHKEALEISSEDINNLLDYWMEFNEEEQFEHFKQNYLERYHPDKGDLAQLLQEFVYNNQSNIIIVIDEISGAFSFLEELYFNKPMDTFLAEFWREHKETQTGIECLFCLASFYDFERRALIYLFDAYEKAKELVFKKYYSMNVYNKKVKAYVVKEVYEELIPVLMKKGYGNEKDILQKYYQEEEKIYQLISETKGLNRDRALYSWGRLYWDSQEYEKALEKWNQIGKAFSSEIFDEIRKVLEGSLEKDTLILRIDKIFNKESIRDNKKLLERLIKYHRWGKR